MPTPDLIPLTEIDQVVFEYLRANGSVVTLSPGSKFLSNHTGLLVVTCKLSGQLMLGSAEPTLGEFLQFTPRKDPEIADFNALLQTWQRLQHQMRMCARDDVSSVVRSFIGALCADTFQQLNLRQKLLEQRIAHYTVLSDEQADDDETADGDNPS